MNDETQPMDAIRTADPWSVRSHDFRDPEVGFGYVINDEHNSRAQIDGPWFAYLAPVSRERSSFRGWYRTAEEAKAAINALADQYRAEDAEVKR